VQPDQARFLLELMLPQVQEEAGTTRKVIAAIPEGRKEYRPDEKSRSAMELAWHIVSSDIHFLEGIIAGQFGVDEPKMPDHIKTIVDLLDWYDRKVPGVIERLKKLSDEELTRPLPFFGIANYAAVVYLTFMIPHAVHHRGWLCGYLRPMGAKVPSIYGGSADEPWVPPA